MRRKTGLFLLFMIIMPTLVFAARPPGSAWLDAGDSQQALILLHGRGHHPTWLVVDPLRKGVHEKLGYHTLSLQMPNEDKHWKEYVDDFPAAYATIKDAIRFLRKEKGVTRIYLMGHSMGSRMASAFVAEHPEQPLAGLIIAGCRNNGGYPLSCRKTVAEVTIPVLDIWGGEDHKDTKSAARRDDLVSETYTQLSVPDANHKFEGKEEELVSVVVDWLQSQEQ
jgi:pimeloyl-ACP methyl ester carboxylesterase